MIPTNDGIYVDECDPLHPTLADFAKWLEVKSHVGRNLSRVDMGSYLVITSAESYPDYLMTFKEIGGACERLNT